MLLVCDAVAGRAEHRFRRTHDAGDFAVSVCGCWLTSLVALTVIEFLNSRPKPAQGSQSAARRGRASAAQPSDGIVHGELQIRPEHIRKRLCISETRFAPEST